MCLGLRERDKNQQWGGVGLKPPTSLKSKRKEVTMAICHHHVSSVKRSSGGNAVGSSAYVSGSKLTFNGVDSETGEGVEKTWDYRNKGGVVYSNISAPAGAPTWVFDREELWNKVEAAEKLRNSQTAHKITIALPIELTLEQNIDMANEYAAQMTEQGMVVDFNIHYDNKNNPHAHYQMTTRELDNESATGFGKKNRNWCRRDWIIEDKKIYCDLQNKYLEMNGFDARVSHLSYEALGITDLKPGKHEGPARHIKDSELRANNLKIMRENAAAIVANPELVFDKISINKPVFTKEDIAMHLSEALAVDTDLAGLSGEEIGDLKEVGKSLVSTKELAKNDKEFQQNSDKNLQENNKKAQESNVKDEANDNNSSSIEEINSAFSEKFLSLYSTLLTSPKIELLNPCDLRGRTLYALTKRLDLERRYTATVEEMAALENHNLKVTKEEIAQHKLEDGIVAYLKEAGRLIEGKINDATNLNLKYFTAEQRKLSDEQLRAVYEIVNGKDLSVLEGFPGAGKTFAMKEIARLYEERGYKVIGTAKSSVAAQVLESEAGIFCMNTTLLRKNLLKSRGDINLEKGFEAFLRTDYFKEATYSKLCNDGMPCPALTAKTVILIDEAGMVDAPDMDYLLTEAKLTGCKVIMVGDNNQLTALGITGSFKKAIEIVGSSRLTSVQRHRNENEDIQSLQREATKLVGQYKIAEAIGIYKKLGYLNICENKQETHEALLRNYISDYLQTANALKAENLPAIRSIAIGAYSNDAIGSLNSTIRLELLKAGILKGVPYTISNGSNRVIELAIGEQIVFTGNKTLWNGYGGVLNGELGTILSIRNLSNTSDNALGNTEGSIITALVHKADGSKKVVKISSADKYPVTMDYGYAITSHKLQGATVDNMKVFFEPSMGYEAFNVLMSRYKYDMKFFAAKDELEKVVWDRTGSDTESLKETHALESYYSVNTGEQRLKVPIPNWLIGLNLAARRRANNNFAVDYAAKEHLTSNELTLKEYLEAREVVFGLESKVRVWQEQIAAPNKLNKLYIKIANQNPKLFKSAKEITIDAYELIYGRSEGNSRQEENRAIYSCLSNHDRRELKHLFSSLKEAKATREETAKVIIDHYQAWVGDKNDRQVSMGDRIIQYNLNYSTIEKHADLSPMRHYLKALKDVKTIAGSEHYKVIMDVIYNITTGKSNQAASEAGEEITVKISRALDLISNEIQATKDGIAQTKEELTLKEEAFESLSKEQRDIAAFSKQLLPEFISRVYKASPQEIIKAWEKLAEAQGLEASLKVVTDNPKVIGSLKGIGLGNFLGLTKERKDALANLNQIPARFKAYEEGKTKMIEIDKEIEEQAYPKVIAELQKTLTASKNNLPTKYEEAFLLKLSNLKAENDLTLNSLTEVANHDDVRGLIYEYYNMLNDNHIDKGSINKKDIKEEGLGKDLKGSDTKSQSTEIKDAIAAYRYNNKPQAAPKLDFAEVSKELTETDYRTIFERYAHLINEDGGTIKERAQELSLGSLTMNVQKGLWTRYSTNEGGNIYSFIEKATNCTKYEALTEVAKLAGILPDKEAEFGKAQSNKTGGTNPSTEPSATKEPKNEWAAMDIIPNHALSFDPKTHLAGLLEHNKLGGIYPYHNAEGKLLGYTVRLISKLDQTKQVMPVAYCQNQYLNKESWRLKGFTDKGYKPIYGIEKLKLGNEATKADQTINKPILIVEGEKTADIAQKLFPEYHVLSWLGGSSSAAKANWEVLQGKEVVIFPDNDTPGIKAANQIAQCINTSNGYIGFVTIIDPSLLTFQGKTNVNLLPEKWDLGDELPKNVTIDNIKEAIDIQKEQTTQLETPNYLKDGNEHKGHESTLEQRIYWQSKLAGSLVTESQMIDLAAKEREISAKLSSPEAKHYMDVAQIRGQNECSHELLKYDHPLYQATLAAVAINESSKGEAYFEISKDKSYHDLPNLISNLQDSYEKKAASFLPYKTTTEKETFEAAKKAVASSHEGSASKAEMFEVLTRDVLMLQSLQIQNLNLEKIPTYLNLRKDTLNQIKETVLSYKASNGRGTDPNKLEDKDREEIAAKAYNKLCTPSYYKAQIINHLEEVNHFQSKLKQVKQFAPNEASILSQMPAKYSLSDSIKAADKRVEEKEIEKEKGYRSFIGWNREKVLGIKELDPKYDLNLLSKELRALSHNHNAMTKHLDTEYGKVFKEKSLPVLREINLQKQKAKSLPELLNIMQKEREYCTHTGQKHWEGLKHHAKEAERYQVLSIEKMNKLNPNYLKGFEEVAHTIITENIWDEKRTMFYMAYSKDYKKTFGEFKDVCRNHFNNEITRDLGRISTFGKVESGDQTFTTPKEYLEHKLNDPISGSYLKDTEHPKTLREIYALEHIDYIGKNFHAIGEGKEITAGGHKFDSQTHYLKYEISKRQNDSTHNDSVHDRAIIKVLEKRLEDTEKHQAVETLFKGFEEHERHQSQQKQSQAQKTLEKTKDDDFSFTM